MRIAVSALASAMALGAFGPLLAAEWISREPGTLSVAEDNSAACVAGFAAARAELTGVLEELRARTKALAEVIIGRSAGDDEIGSKTIRIPPTVGEVTAALNRTDGLTNSIFQGWTTPQLLWVVGVIASKWPGSQRSLLDYKEEVTALRDDAQKLATRISRPFRGDLGEQLDESFARRREAERLRGALLNAAKDGRVSVSQLAASDVCKGRLSRLN